MDEKKPQETSQKSPQQAGKKQLPESQPGELLEEEELLIKEQEVQPAEKESTPPVAEKESTPPVAEKESGLPENVVPKPMAATQELPSLEARLGPSYPFQLKISLGKEQLQELVFDKDTISIGRDASCDVIIDNLAASRVHAKIERIGRFYVLRDAGSKTGTFVHGTKIEEYHLNSGDEIFLAKHTLVFQRLSSLRWHGTAIKEDAGRPPRPTTKSMPRQQDQLMQTMAVDFKDKAKKQGSAPAQLNLIGVNRRLPVTKTVTFFGKANQCDLPVNGFLIGERQAALIQEDRGFTLYHLGLWKPPRVNNQMVNTAVLKDGDVVDIGDLHFIFQSPQQG